MKILFKKTIISICTLLVMQISFSNANAQTLPVPDHIVIVIFENYAYQQIVGSTAAPHINALAADTNAAFFTQCFAIEHPSQPNYLDFFAGNNQGVTSNGVPSGIPFTTPNLAAQLLTASKTFVSYAEDMPSVGFTGATSGLYFRKHNPIANWVGTGTNQVPASLNQPFTSFPSPANFSTLPTISYVIPNSVHDMHDGSFPSNVTAGDTWDYNTFDTLRKWSLANNTLYVLTFDEDDETTHGNQITTIFYGPMVKGGQYSEHINLYNMLRTFEAMYGLSYIGNAATATTITDCWKNSGSISGINTESSPNSVFKLFPNPANTAINFLTNKPLSDPSTIIITDVLGNVISKNIMIGATFNVSTTSYSAGVYFYKAVSNTGIISQGTFVVSH